MQAERIDPATIQIVPFPHPALRHPAKPIRRVDGLLRDIVGRMFDLMYEHRGVGLAAPQVDLPLRLFVMNASGQRGEGVERVLINPVVSRPRGSDEAEEGCLSLPGVHGIVMRPKTVHVHAYDLSGEELDEDFTGFEARVIQHEHDHLNGLLFIDRLQESALVEIEDAVQELVDDFRGRQRQGEIPPDETLREQLLAWESMY
ncbi:MAG: peptide deformylase, partial [Planctomycetota bacterium]